MDRPAQPTGRAAHVAIEELHALLLSAARFEVGGAGPRSRTCAATTARTSRSRAPTTRWSPSSASSTTSAATAASPPGRTSSRCYEAAAKIRQRAWQGREIPLEPETWLRFADPASAPHERRRDARAARRPAGRDRRRAHARTSARCWSRSRSTTSRSTSSPSACNTTRGALYKTLHDARHKLRAALRRRARPRRRPAEPTR